MADALLLDELHAPLEPLLRELATSAGWPAGGLLLDIACGPGLKSSLLRAALGPGGRIIGLDHDSAALHAAQAADGRRQTADGRRQTADYAPASSFILHPSSLHWLAADAAALPLRHACADGVWCAAALGLLADPAAALHEQRRVLRPGGVALLITGAQAWAAIHPWPAPLLDELSAAYRAARAAGVQLPQCELGDELAGALCAAGFSATTRVFLLRPAAQALHAELPLLPWPPLRAALELYAAPATLAAATRLATAPEEVELVPLLLAGIGTAG